MIKDISELIQRNFTKELDIHPEKTVYDLFTYKTIDVKIIDHATGEAIVDMQNLEFPEHYSKNACNIIASKYFRKAGLDTPEGHETSMRQLADRMVGFWADSLKDEGLIKNEGSGRFFMTRWYMPCFRRCGHRILRSGSIRN
jgi:ribonucleoside-diphosphate reductase alpha chain